MLRSFVKSTTTRQLQAISPNLEEVYLAFAKDQGFEPKNITLSDGNKAYWIGDPSAEKVILWFHGGGYNLPPEPGHLKFASGLSQAADPNIPILLLAYTLVPHGTYPTQLREAVELLRHTVTELKKKPEDVSIGGDSAGANLAIGVLSHLMHPHPEIEPLRLETNLGAAILLAPWASFRTDWPSTTYNANKDIVSARAGDKWSQSFLGGKEKDAYNEPLSADPGWWRGLDDVVRDIMVVGGGDEVLIDCIRELARQFEVCNHRCLSKCLLLIKMQAFHPGVITVIAPDEWHDQPTVTILGQGGEQDAAIKSFVKSRL
ncbi:hypothetical protein P7C71_g2233, partial [Lecanoromycetidae sp. Uapishka_2]